MQSSEPDEAAHADIFHLAPENCEHYQLFLDACSLWRRDAGDLPAWDYPGLETFLRRRHLRGRRFEAAWDAMLAMEMGFRSGARQRRDEQKHKERTP